MVFVVDASGSVGSSNFDTTKQFLTNVAQSFQVCDTQVFSIHVYTQTTRTLYEFFAAASRHGTVSILRLGLGSCTICTRKRRFHRKTLFQGPVH